MTRNALIALLVLLLFAGCGEDGQKKTSTQSPPVVTKKAPPKKVTAPLEEQGEKGVSEEDVYTYNPSGKRDPFKSLLDIQRPVVAEQKEPLTPLQRFGLGQMRLLGVVVGLEEPKAMIVAPDAKSYILKIGTKIGKNNGTVIDINSDGVFVEEVYYDFAGEVKKNVKTLNLPKREGVK